MNRLDSLLNNVETRTMICHKSVIFSRLFYLFNRKLHSLLKARNILRSAASPTHSANPARSVRCNSTVGRAMRTRAFDTDSKNAVYTAHPTILPYIFSCRGAGNAEVMNINTLITSRALRPGKSETADCLSQRRQKRKGQSGFQPSMYSLRALRLCELYITTKMIFFPVARKTVDARYAPRTLPVIDRVSYSTVTDFARLRGWSTSVPFCTATK